MLPLRKAFSKGESSNRLCSTIFPSNGSAPLYILYLSFYVSSVCVRKREIEIERERKRKMSVLPSFSLSLLSPLSIYRMTVEAIEYNLTTFLAFSVLLLTLGVIATHFIALFHW
jgi:hypothetical protein